MKTYTYILFFLNEDKELKECGYTKFSNALLAFKSISGKCMMQKFCGHEYIKDVMSK